MSLSSNFMQLSANEKRWLPWFGKTGKLTMGWSCWLNRSAYPVIEQTFEAIAETRGAVAAELDTREVGAPGGTGGTPEC
jgi:hypothetical protein